MKKNLKKFGALVLAVMMIAALSVTAFADGLRDTTVTGTGTLGELYDSASEGAAIADNSFTFRKEIIIYNTTSATVHEPEVTYTYTIAPVTMQEGTPAWQTVTDGDDDVGRVYTGVAPATVGLTVGTAAFDADNTVANADNDGAVAYKDVTVTIGTVGAFPHAGIFRYSLTEADNSAARTAAGVSRGSAYGTAVRYLDIYVRNANTGDTAAQQAAGKVVYGFVMFKDPTNAGVTSISKTATEVTKTDGFSAVPVSTGSYDTTPADSDYDFYQTYNLIVTKTIDGGVLADASHAFPMSVALTKAITANTAQFEYDFDGATGTGTLDAATKTFGDATTGGYTTSAIKLANGDTATFYGLPAGTTAVVTELNDTYDIYTANQDTYTGFAVSGDCVLVGADGDGNKQIARFETAVFQTATNATTLTLGATADTNLGVTNTIAIVSPTGVVMRVAPYFLMMAAGVAFLVISRRRRAEA